MYQKWIMTAVTMTDDSDHIHDESKGTKYNLQSSQHLNYMWLWSQSNSAMVV